MNGESKNISLSLSLLFIILFPFSSFTQQTKNQEKCDLTRSSQLVKQLGLEISDDFETIKCLSQSPYKSIGLLINELQPLKETAIPNEIDTEKKYQKAEHVLMCVRGLRYITGGMDFQAPSSYRFKDSEKQRNYFLHNFEREPERAFGIFKDPNIKFFAMWPSHGVEYIAPQDAQLKIIQKWKDWYSKIDPNHEFHPLRDPAPEDWLW
jgi:hypothetical protein